jgi:hypothetical protein
MHTFLASNWINMQKSVRKLWGKCGENVGKLDYSVVCRNVCSFLIVCTGEMCHTCSVSRFNQKRGNVKY